MNYLRADHELPKAILEWGWQFHHLGIPTTDSIQGETYLPHLKFYTSGFASSPFGVEWMRFDSDCPLDEIIKSQPHLAFCVNNLEEALKRGNFKILVEPTSPSKGVRVAMFEHNGAAIEILEFVKTN
ncbi:MAG: hypothetical protein KJ578_04860 [Bacteroidetes bacterium]|nr:hypothetical protein [Bacteroidota bacterium]MBU2557094.1 hypothetical protein [Bacteroidota bacterium]